MLLVLLALSRRPCARADWNGDGPGDVLTIHPDGRLLLYRGNGAGGWVTGAARASAAAGAASPRCSRPATSPATASPTCSRATPDGRLLMYRGDGAGGWGGTPQTVGSGWGPFTALLAPGDFTGDGHPDVLARNTDGLLLLYRGDGDGGWVTGKAETIGSGWGPFKAVLAGGRLHRRRQARRVRGHRPTARCCSTAATAPAAG